MNNTERPRWSARRIVLVAMFTALALAAGFAESRFPLPFPGMRLGVANIFPLTALLFFGPREAVTVALLRLLVAFFLSGNVFSFLCSAGGLALSLPVTILLHSRFRDSLSVPAISSAAAFAFNFGQVSAVAFAVRAAEVFAYLPALLLCGAFTGFAVGVLAENLRGRLSYFLAR
jgi:heptaprenyl diphosphate synthase